MEIKSKPVDEQIILGGEYSSDETVAPDVNIDDIADLKAQTEIRDLNLIEKLRRELAQIGRNLTHKPQDKAKNDTLLLGNEVFPQRNVAEIDGYKMSVNFYGTFKQFQYVGDRAAKKGDLKGSIRIKGPGVNIRIGNRFFPVVLDYPDLVVSLGEKIENKYNRQPNWRLMHELGTVSLKPYAISLRYKEDSDK